MDFKLSHDDIKRYNWYIWRFLIGCFVFVVLLIGLTALGLFGSLKSFRELENPKSNLASEIISSDNKTFATFYAKENRSRVNYNNISKNAVNALVATEDNHFYSHSGIDLWRMFTIIPYNLIGSKQGGSTITQQLALHLFSGEERASNIFSRISQKLREWIIAVKIEKHYTKEEIITMYLNTVDFGNNSFGISSAALTYFNTTADKLTPDQAAMLIAVLNGPSYFSPIRHPDRALTRRNFILGRMAAEGFLSEGQVAEFRAKPLGLNFHPISYNEGPAPYFRVILKNDIKKIFTEQSITKADGTPYDLDKDGLKIYVTLNASMQQYAEEAQKQYMRELQAVFNNYWKGRNLKKEINNYEYLIKQGKQNSDRYKELVKEGKTDEEITENFNTPDKMNIFTWHGDIDTLMKPIDSIVYCKLLLRNSVMSMDPTTGYVKAWVGGIDHEHFKYDQVKTGNRQVGSTAKPFTYAVAITKGYSPCEEVKNEPVTISGYGGQDWTPGSADTFRVNQFITLRTALAHSQNWVTAFVMKNVTPEPVVTLIKKMGVNSPDISAVPSICLGTFNASVFDMTGAYSVFANHGIWTQPTYLLCIKDKNGKVIYPANGSIVSPKKEQAMKEQTAYVMIDMLKSVIKEGTGIRLGYKYNFTNPIAGKTGTTQDNSDGWFIGITPQLVTGVWTGCEDRDVHFKSTRLGEGANTALPIFAYYMQKVYADAALGIKKSADFDRPKGDLPQLDCSVYKQQTTGAKEVDKKLKF